MNTEAAGRQVGLTVAKKLGMEFYDKELIDAAAKEIGFPTEMIADREQRLTNSLLYNFAMGTLYGIAYPREPKVSELPLTEQIYQAQKKAIEEAAKRGSCIFVGRCADYILKAGPMFCAYLFMQTGTSGREGPLKNTVR